MTLATRGLAWSALSEIRAGTRDGGDPLGFRAFATRLAREIAPGVTQSTDQARAFGVFCLGLRDFGMMHDDGNWGFVEFETYWVCAQTHHFRQTPELNRWRGKQAARWRVEAAAANGEVHLKTPLLQRQLSSGIWGAYRRTAGLFGLTRRATQRARPETGLLTTLGADLAEATAAATRTDAGKAVQFAARIKKGKVPYDGLSWIHKDAKPTSAELAVLNTGIRAYDSANDCRQAALHESWEDSGELSISALEIEPILPQSAAVAAAAAVLRLLDELEPPLREWAATGQAPEIDPRIWDSPDWAHVEAWSQTELLNLRKIGRNVGSGLAALQQHHRWLAEVRGAPPWEPGMVEPAVVQFVPPTFALPAVTALFRDGVNPRG